MTRGTVLGDRLERERTGLGRYDVGLRQKVSR